MLLARRVHLELGGVHLEQIHPRFGRGTGFGRGL